LSYLQKLLESPFVGHLGTSDEKHKVFRTIFFSAGVIENPTRLVIYIPEVGLEDVRRNLSISDYAAATLIALTFECVQVKGSITIRPATDLEESNSKVILQRLAALQYPERIFTMRRKPLMAVEMVIIEIYNQTPGTGAGERLVFE
jgi:hypothetical protein